MKVYDWDDKKNEKLKKERSISFEEVIIAIENGKLLDIVLNKKHKYQKMFIIEIYNYVYCVPFVNEKDKVVLKTIYPSKKATQKYLL